MSLPCAVLNCWIVIVWGAVLAHIVFILFLFQSIMNACVLRASIYTSRELTRSTEHNWVEQIVLALRTLVPVREKSKQSFICLYTHVVRCVLILCMYIRGVWGKWWLKRTPLRLNVAGCVLTIRLNPSVKNEFAFIYVFNFEFSCDEVTMCAAHIIFIQSDWKMF